jgi:hypothetical protein
LTDVVNYYQLKEMVMLRPVLTTLAAAAFVVSVWAAPAQAQGGLPSSKATADVNTLVKCKFSTQTSNDGDFTLPTTCVDWFSGATVDTDGAWIEIMSKPMKLSNSQSLFVSPSLVTGLYTQTRTKTTTGSTSTAQAMGAVYMRAVLIPAGGGDPIVAAPLNLCGTDVFGCSAVNNEWGVVLDSRIQTLSQSISDCTVLVEGVSGTCEFTSVIDLILQTASAHTFNFIFPSVGQGTYTVKVYAALGSGASVIGSGSAVGSSAFGLGSMTVESVRLVHDFVF